MPHIEEIRDYWNLRANGFALAVDAEMDTESAREWTAFFRETFPEPVDILDDGTGPGFFPAILAPMGHRVTAIDYSEGMVERARARFEALGLAVDVTRGDAQRLAFEDDHFDAVVSRNVLWNLDDPARAYAEMHRVLRPGGKLVVDDGNMYLYLHDAGYAAAHERAMAEMKRRAERDGGLHGKYNVDNVDFSIIERIAEDLPMSRTLRPQWDFEQLVKLGFDDIRVAIRGKELPMGFRITARKRETPWQR